MSESMSTISYGGNGTSYVGSNHPLREFICGRHQQCFRFNDVHVSQYMYLFEVAFIDRQVLWRWSRLNASQRLAAYLGEGFPPLGVGKLPEQTRNTVTVTKETITTDVSVPKAEGFSTDEPECTCPNDDLWMCVKGTVYGPCSADNCGGVCESEGRCDCPLHKIDPQHDINDED